MKARRRIRVKSTRPAEKEWLENMQLNSWEAELLISALTVFVLFKTPDRIFLFASQNFPSGSSEQLFFNTTAVSIYFLSLGFVLHLILRSFWVAQLGISYAFPQGILSEKLGFKGKFRKELNNHSSYPKFILRIEKVTSAIYGISFLLFGALLGTVLIFTVFGLIFNLFAEESIFGTGSSSKVIQGFFAFVYFMCVLLLFSDFIFDGYLRKRSWTAKIFYPIAVFFRIITLSFLFRRSLLILLSNLRPIYRKTLPVLLIGSIGFIGIIEDQISKLQSDTYFENVGSEKLLTNYEDLREEGMLLVATLPSELVSGEYITLFIKDQKIFKSLYELENPSKGRWTKATQENKREFFQKSLIITENDSVLNWQNFYSINHPVEYDYGYQFHLDLREFNSGFFELEISISVDTLNEEQVRLLKEEKRTRLAFIPFYYHKP